MKLHNDETQTDSTREGTAAATPAARRGRVRVVATRDEACGWDDAARAAWSAALLTQAGEAHWLRHRAESPEVRRVLGWLEGQLWACIVQARRRMAHRDS